MFLLKILIIFMVPYKIRAGLQAFGIFPLSVEKVLSRLPPEDGLREEVQNEFCRQLTEQLHVRRYGDPAEKPQQAKKANRLPAGSSYTVSAIPANEEEADPLPGTSGDTTGTRGAQGRGTAAGRRATARGGRGRGGGRGGGRAVRHQVLISDEENESDAEFDAEEIIPTDFLGVDIDKDYSSDSSAGSGTEDEDEETAEEFMVDDPASAEESIGGPPSDGRKETGDSTGTGTSTSTRAGRTSGHHKDQYQVGQFVTAIYEGRWLVARVDADQSGASNTHINLNYMETVGDNKFKWPKHPDLLMTLKKDILTVCSTPTLVGSSTRATYVCLSSDDAAAAEFAFDEVVYLQLVFSKETDFFYGQLFRYRYVFFSFLKFTIKVWLHLVGWSLDKLKIDLLIS